MAPTLKQLKKTRSIFVWQTSCSLFQAFRKWEAVRSKNEREKIKTSEGKFSLYFPSLSVLRTSPHSLNALWNRLDFVERHSSEAFVLAPFSGCKFVHDGQCEY